MRPLLSDSMSIVNENRGPTPRTVLLLMTLLLSLVGGAGYWWFSQPRQVDVSEFQDVLEIIRDQKEGPDRGLIMLADTTTWDRLSPDDRRRRATRLAELAV